MLYAKTKARAVGGNAAFNSLFEMPVEAEDSPQRGR